jgi:hypothetical protein
MIQASGALAPMGGVLTPRSHRLGAARQHTGARNNPLDASPKTGGNGKWRTVTPAMAGYRAPLETSPLETPPLTCAETIRVLMSRELTSAKIVVKPIFPKPSSCSEFRIFAGIYAPQIANVHGYQNVLVFLLTTMLGDVQCRCSERKHPRLDHRPCRTSTTSNCLTFRQPDLEFRVR